MKKVILAATALLFLLPGLASAEFLSVQGDKANFRKGPSVKTEIAYTADKYYPVKVLQKKEGWYQVVDYAGDKAWVLGKLLSNQKALVVKKEKANIRQKASTKSKVVFTASEGAAFKLIKVSGNWALVQHLDGDRGWVHRSLTWGY